MSNISKCLATLGQLKGVVDNVKNTYPTKAEVKALVGTPLVAATAADMTDHNKIYVYTGSQTGYNNGHWYYWNGSAWVDGGVYNAVAVDTDKTLSIEGKAADAKKTGDELSELKSDLNEFKDAVFVGGSGGYPHKTVIEFTEYSYPSGTSYPPETSRLQLRTQDGWNSWYGVVSQAMDIFFDSSLNIGTFIIAKISNVTNKETLSDRIYFTGTDPVRYKYEDGEGFPTESSKLHINANDTVIITLPTSVSANNVLIYYGEQQSNTTLLNENVQLNDTQLSSAFPDRIKSTLLLCLRHLQWDRPSGESYYDLIAGALYSAEYPKISATFNPNGATIYAGSVIDDLKQYLTVKYYDSSSSSGTTVSSSNYWLAGRINVGSNRILVRYGDYVTSFVVTGQVRNVLYSLPTPMIFHKDASEVVDTGLQLFSTDRSYTIIAKATLAVEYPSLQSDASAIFSVKGLNFSLLQFLNGEHTKTNINLRVNPGGSTVRTFGILGDWRNKTFNNIILAGVSHEAGTNTAIARLYVDGNLASEGNFDGAYSYSQNDNNLIIGANHLQAGFLYPLSGTINEFVVYSESMTQTQLDNILLNI